MSPLSKSTVFFDESVLIADEWALKRLTNAARRLVPPQFRPTYLYQVGPFHGQSPVLPACPWLFTKQTTACVEDHRD